MDSQLNNVTNKTAAYGSGSGDNQLLALAWIILIPIALLGNIFVIRTVFTVPEMKSSTNFLFVNMAICDILTALTLVPKEIAEFRVFFSSKWFSGVVGVVTCKTVLYVGYATIVGSIAALTLMAIDRFFAICYPLKRISFFKSCKLVTLLVWLPSLVITLPVAVVAKIEVSDGITACAMNIDENWQSIFLVYLSILSYFLPLLIMAVLYGFISKRLWFSKVPTESLAGEDSHRLLKRERNKRKIVLLLMVVLGVFAFCWLPVQIYHLLIATESGTSIIQSEAFQPFALWLAHANSAINPCLYISLHSGFRRAFLQFLSRCGLRRPARNERNKTTSFQTTLTANTRI